MEWSEGNMSLKNPVTPPGINPGTIRPVVQRLNHYATPGPVQLCEIMWTYMTYWNHLWSGVYDHPANLHSLVVSMSVH
jgi:hypothetical protein